jgi:hypothetical protein
MQFDFDLPIFVFVILILHLSVPSILLVTITQATIIIYAPDIASHERFSGWHYPDGPRRSMPSS